MSITFYRNLNRAAMNTTAEPTIEAQAGTDSLSRAISAGGQAADLMDGNRHTLLSASPFTELVANGGFDDTSNWTTPAEWSISGGKAQGDTSGGGGGADMTQGSVVVLGSLYRVTFTVSEYSSGSVTVKLGTSAGSARAANGTFTEDITAAGNTTLTFTAANVSDLKIDDVTIKALDLRFELAADLRIDAGCLIIDNTDLLDAFPAAARSVVDLYHHTSDDFGSATRLTPTKVYGGLPGKGRPYLDFDGVDDYVQVVDAAALDPGYGDFTFEIILRPKDLSQTVFWLSRETDANNRFYLRYNQASGAVDCRFQVGGTVLHEAKGTWNPSVDTRYHIFWKVENGSTNTIKINDTAVTLDQANTVAGGDMSLAVALNFMLRSSTYAKGDVLLVRLHNKALTDAEMTAYFNGGGVPAGDQWGQVYYDSDWSAGVDGWSSSNITLAGDIDGITDGATPYDNCLRATINAGSSAHHFRILDKVANTGNKTRIELLYYIPSGQSNVDGFKVKSNSSAVIHDATSTGSTPATIGTWTSLVLDYTPDSGAADDLRIYPHDGSAETFDDTGGDDIIYLAYARQSQVGCLAEYAPDGIGKTAATWHDSSDNDLDGAITGADYRQTPAGSERGFLLYEFAETNARYWFVEINGGNLTATANPKFGQLVIGKAFTPSVSPDLEGTFGSGTGTTSRISYGGQKYVQRRFDPRYRRELAWSYISAADRAEFEALFDDIGVAEEGPSLYALYYAEEASGADPILRAARVMGRPTFTETAYGAWSLSLTLEDEV